jgi:hypothetical protein
MPPTQPCRFRLTLLRPFCHSVSSCVGGWVSTYELTLWRCLCLIRPRRHRYHALTAAQPAHVLLQVLALLHLLLALHVAPCYYKAAAAAPGRPPPCMEALLVTQPPRPPARLPPHEANTQQLPTVPSIQRPSLHVRSPCRSTLFCHVYIPF